MKRTLKHSEYRGHSGLRRTVAALALSAGAVGTIALYQGLVLRVYTLTTDRLARGRLRFVSVSDLHGLTFGEGQSRILGYVRRTNPDYILLPGDLFDERKPAAATQVFLRGAAAIAPCYYAPGNHEYRTRQFSAVTGIVKKCGVTPLLDRALSISTPLGALVLAGCEDSERTRLLDPRYHLDTALRSAFGSIKDADGYRVLLAHRPEHIPLYRSLGFHLVVSGHTHGGQFRIPYLLDGVYASGQGFFPPYCGGCFHYHATDHIIGRGVAMYKYLPRVFNPPEIVVIDVIGTAR